MCFSAEASFTVSAVLLITGAASIKKVITPSQLVFASIPIVFSIQQFLEGILWLSLKNTTYMQWQTPATYGFLVFAQVLWPVWVPLAFLLLEKDTRRKRFLSILFGMGAILAIYHIYCLFYYQVSFKVSEHHIQYRLLFPDSIKWLTRVGYFLPIIISSFLSSVKRTWLLGTMNLLSFLVSFLFFHDDVISVWCFFAAIISGLILFVMHFVNKEHRII